ncbi:glutaredoxin domain-containing protein [Palaeococcus ferrophilus]|uniref:glutaredoxin domain-containing protein n=1 Tax=Palaeococcus ferrophilus TaxID=83868 RepID=UPI00064FDF38|nr:glutaredoxin domain-containing protein [Palaeococcus ferrophilus]
MRKLYGLVILLIVLSTLSHALAQGEIDPKKVHFYMYGAATCPHCKKMKEEIPKAFGADSLTYYELVNNDENSALFGEIYRLTGISGVPAIGIAYDGKLYAIIEGEFNVSATPEIIKEAQERNGMFLVTGGKVYLIPRNETEGAQTIAKLETLFIEHRSATGTTGTSPTTTSNTETTETTSTALPTTTGTNENKTCGPAFIGLLALLPLLMRRANH